MSSKHNWWKRHFLANIQRFEPGSIRVPASTILRLFAAWLVVTCHAPGLSGKTEADFLSNWTGGIFSASFLALSIFFVLSGHLVAGSAYRSRNWFDFAKRRFLRVAPGWIACCMVVCLVIGPILSDVDLLTYWGDGALLLSFSKILFGSAHWDLPGLFTTHAMRSANGSVWTIPYEVAFYGLMGVAMFGFGRKFVGTRWVVLGLWIGLSVALSIPSFLPDSAEVRVLGFRMTFFAEFGAWFLGGWALLYFRLDGRLGAGLALFALLVKIWATGTATQMTFDTLCMPVVVLWAARLPVGPLERIWDVSYGYYLWGWPVQQIIVQFWPTVPMSAFLLTSTFAVLGPATLSWLFVERRFLLRSSPSQDTRSRAKIA